MVTKLSSGPVSPDFYILPPSPPRPGQRKNVNQTLSSTKSKKRDQVKVEESTPNVRSSLKRPNSPNSTDNAIMITKNHRRANNDDTTSTSEDVNVTRSRKPKRHRKSYDGGNTESIITPFRDFHRRVAAAPMRRHSTVGLTYGGNSRDGSIVHVQARVPMTEPEESRAVVYRNQSEDADSTTKFTGISPLLQSRVSATTKRKWKTHQIEQEAEIRVGSGVKDEEAVDWSGHDGDFMILPPVPPRSNRSEKKIKIADSPQRKKARISHSRSGERRGSRARQHGTSKPTLEKNLRFTCEISTDGREEDSSDIDEDGGDLAKYVRALSGFLIYDDWIGSKGIMKDFDRIGSRKESKLKAKGWARPLDLEIPRERNSGFGVNAKTGAEIPSAWERQRGGYSLEKTREEDEVVEVIIEDLVSFEPEIWEVVDGKGGKRKSLAAMWIESPYAWYRLESPALEYEPHMSRLIRYLRCFGLSRHFLLKNPALTCDDIATKVTQEPDLYIQPVNFKSSGSRYKDQAFPLQSEELLEWSTLLQEDLVNQLERGFGGQEDVFYSDDDDDVGGDDDDDSNPLKQATTVRKKKKLEISEKGPFTTPLVHRLAGDLFGRKIRCPNEQPVTGEESEIELLTCDPKWLSDQPKRFRSAPEWIDEPICVVDSRKFYRAASVDKKVFSPGDMVLVNTEGSEPWFCQIQFFFEDEDGEGAGKKQFHGRWFESGKNTPLGASSREIYALDWCNDNDIESILRKEEGCAWRDPKKAFPDENGPRFYRHVWDDNNRSFINYIPAEDPHSPHPSSSSVQPVCQPCKRYRIKDPVFSDCTQHKNCSHHPELQQDDIHYHTGDFVYLIPDQLDNPFMIGHLEGLNSRDLSATVRLLVRTRALSSDCLVRPRIPNILEDDEREVLLTPFRTSVKIRELRGTCYVFRWDPSAKANQPFCLSTDRQVLELHKYNDHFILSSALDSDLQNISFSKFKTSLHGLLVNGVTASSITHTDFSPCNECYSRWKSDMKSLRDFLKSDASLKVMDLCCGAGGMSEGLRQTGVLKPTWAVDLDPAAAATYQANHGATVYNECLNDFLEEGVKAKSGARNREWKKEGRPLKGDVDVLIAGFPCQALSGLNRFPKADDVRLSLIPTVLGFVEHFEPRFVIFENVPRLFTSRLGGKLVDRRIVGGIERGLEKLILQTFVQLGYQVHWEVVNSASFGCAQSRRRAIVLCSKNGVPLPAFPRESHISRNVQVDCPHRGVNVADLISDLPEFGFEDPDRKPTKTHANKLYPAVGQGVVGLVQQTYRCSPQNMSQQRLRCQGVFDLTLHVTFGFQKELSVKLINSVPTRLNKDGSAPNWNQLPGKFAFKPRNDKNSTILRRLKEHEPFPVILASQHDPFSGKAACLHPTQNRTLSVRETARAQGFPDSYKFIVGVGKRPNDVSNKKEVKECLRLIGNSVPVQLAFALGWQIRSVVHGEFKSIKESIPIKVEEECFP